MKQSLSDTRGSRGGFLFFILFLRCFGTKHARIMVRIVSFFYALFDRRAREKAIPYLSRRFPGDRGFRRFRHVWLMFAKQGEALLALEAVRLGKMKVVFHDASPEVREARQPGRGFVLLNSHFGPWQATLQAASSTGSVFNIFMMNDRNRQVDKLTMLRDDPAMKGKVRVINPESSWGGLIEAREALERNEIVTVMGDRSMEANPLRIPFLGEEADFPVAGFYLAAKAHRSVICIFAHESDTDPDTVILDFAGAIRPEMKGRDRTELAPYLKEYVSLLEKFSLKYPYNCFMFEDIWEKP